MYANAVNWNVTLWAIVVYEQCFLGCYCCARRLSYWLLSLCRNIVPFCKQCFLGCFCIVRRLFYWLLLLCASIVSVMANKMSQQPTFDDNDNEDPGIIFVLWPSSMGATSVHQCLGLGCVSSLVPPLAQGATPEQSVDNLYRWLDIIVTTLGFGSTMATCANGKRIPGVYHHMSKEELVTFRGHLETITRQWHIECLINNFSAGFMLEVTGGTCGKGSLLTSAINIGPFIY